MIEIGQDISVARAKVLGNLQHLVCRKAELLANPAIFYFSPDSNVIMILRGHKVHYIPTNYRPAIGSRDLKYW